MKNEGEILLSPRRQAQGWLRNTKEEEGGRRGERENSKLF
jgi:hypothetical protein